MKLPSPLTETHLEEYLDNYYFFRSLEHPSLHEQMVYLAQLKGCTRSAEIEQYGPADSEADLDRIHEHRRVRTALQALPLTSLYALSIVYDEGLVPDAQVRKNFDEVARLAGAPPNIIFWTIAAECGPEDFNVPSVRYVGAFRELEMLNRRRPFIASKALQEFKNSLDKPGSISAAVQAGISLRKRILAEFKQSLKEVCK